MELIEIKDTFRDIERAGRDAPGRGTMIERRGKGAAALERAQRAAYRGDDASSFADRGRYAFEHVIQPIMVNLNLYINPLSVYQDHMATLDPAELNNFSAFFSIAAFQCMDLGYGNLMTVSRKRYDLLSKHLGAKLNRECNLTLATYCDLYISRLNPDYQVHRLYKFGREVPARVIPYARVQDVIRDYIQCALMLMDAADTLEMRANAPDLHDFYEEMRDFFNLNVVGNKLTILTNEESAAPHLDAKIAYTKQLPILHAVEAAAPELARELMARLPINVSVSIKPEGRGALNLPVLPLGLVEE